jgi:hypothetical protein
MLDKYPIDKQLIQKLYKLVSVPFTLSAFQECWTGFGWIYTLNSGDEYGFRVNIPGNTVLSVASLGDGILSAKMSFCYWEEYEPEWHEDVTEYVSQKAEFDLEFDRALVLTSEVLGNPAVQWQDVGPDAYRAVAWQAPHGILILQQACFDPQFGIELNFWLEPIVITDFKPESPLIDWLCCRNNQRVITELKDGKCE